MIEYPLRAASFTNVHSLSLHFVSTFPLLHNSHNLIYSLQGEAVGEEMSRIYFIGFKGDTRTVRKEGSNKLEVPAANAADASLVDRVKERAAGQQSTAR